MKFPATTDYLVIAADKKGMRQRFLRKSGRYGGGTWQTTSDYLSAEPMRDLSRAKTVLKSKGASKIEISGWRLKVIRVKATFQTEKVWPLSPLEHLAKAAE